MTSKKRVVLFLLLSINAGLIWVECDRKRRYFSSGSRDEHPDRRRAWNYSDHHQARYQLRGWVWPL